MKAVNIIVRAGNVSWDRGLSVSWFTTELYWDTTTDEKVSVSLQDLRLLIAFIL
jgi:hypothetical protein